MQTSIEDIVAKHNTSDDAWVIIENVVYDVTKFLDVHPGGKDILLSKTGQDVSYIFTKGHSRLVLNKIIKYKVDINTSSKKIE